MARKFTDFAIEFSCTGPNRLASVDWDGNVYIWDAETFQHVFSFPSTWQFGGRRIVLDPTGRWCVTASYHKGGVACYEAETGELMWRRPELRQVQYVSASHDGQLVYCGVDRGPARALLLENGDQLYAFRGVKKIFESRYADLRFLIHKHCGDVQTLTGSDLFRVRFETFAVLDVIFSPSALCFAEAGGPVRCIDCEKGEEMWRYTPPPSSGMRSLGYSRQLGSFFGVLAYHNIHAKRLVQLDERNGACLKSLPIGCPVTAQCIPDRDMLVTSQGVRVDLTTMQKL